MSASSRNVNREAYESRCERVFAVREAMELVGRLVAARPPGASPSRTGSPRLDVAAGSGIMVAMPVPDEIRAVRGGYDRWAAVYDSDRNPLPALEEPRVRAAVGDVRGLEVLDLGCGTGRHASWLLGAGATVTAVDFSEGMLAEARRKPEAASVRFVLHDLHEPLPFRDGAFDLVVSGLVLEHLADLEAFFGEAHRVLRPARRAVVSAMHPAMFLRNSRARFTDPLSGEVVQPGSLPHGIADMVMAALRAGFRLEGMSEHTPDAAFAAHYPRAQKYVGWPMLVVLTLQSGDAPHPPR